MRPSLAGQPWSLGDGQASPDQGVALLRGDSERRGGKGGVVTAFLHLAPAQGPLDAGVVRFGVDVIPCELAPLVRSLLGTVLEAGTDRDSEAVNRPTEQVLRTFAARSTEGTCDAHRCERPRQGSEQLGQVTGQVRPGDSEESCPLGKGNRSPEADAVRPWLGR